jgi:hypothetical protein
MRALNLHPNIAGPDDLYQRLVGLHEGLTDAQSLRASAALILLLANHIGDGAVIAEAIDAARRQVLPGGLAPGSGA